MLRRIAWGLLLVGVPALSVAADPDLYWHILTGQRILELGALPAVDPWSYTFTGQPWVNHEWVPDVVLAWAFDTLGSPGLLALRAVLLTVLMGAWLDAVGRRLPAPALAWLVVALPWPLLALLCNLRPQTVTWALVPVVLAVVDRAVAGHRTAVWALPAVIVLWVNLHGGFLFGWGLAGLGLLLSAAGLEGVRLSARERVERLVAAAVVAVAPLLNPFGLDLLRYIRDELTAGHPDLPEWNAPVGLMVPILVLAVAVPLVLQILTRRLPRAWTSWVGLLVATLAAMSASKFVALVMIVGTVCAAEALGVLWARRAERDPEARRLVGSLPFAVGVLALGALLHLPLRSAWVGVTAGPPMLPGRALSWLAGAGVLGEGRLATPLGWGGPALYLLDARWQVSLDGRNTTVYPVPFVDAQTHAWRDGDADVLLSTRPDAALVPRRGKMAPALKQRGWTVAYEGDAADVMVPPGVVLQAPEPPPLTGRFPR